MFFLTVIIASQVKWIFSRAANLLPFALLLLRCGKSRKTGASNRLSAHPPPSRLIRVPSPSIRYVINKEELLRNSLLSILKYKQTRVQRVDVKSGVKSGRLFFGLAGKSRGERERERRKWSVMSHGRRREIIPSLHKCIGYVGGKWDVGRAVCRVP